MPEPIELAFVVACAPHDAFDLWTRRASLWWPKGHSVSRDPRLEVLFEPAVGGRILERTPSGEEHVWGELTAWEPPHRLAYQWHLRQERADATAVEVTFAALPTGGTQVRVVHRGWERLGDRAAGLRDRNRSGWDGLLPHYTAAAGEAVPAPSDDRRSP